MFKSMRKGKGVNVTRFGETQKLWQKFKRLWQF